MFEARTPKGEAPIAEFAGTVKVEDTDRGRQVTLTPDDLAFCHADMRTYAEPGEFHLWVSTDSQSGTPVSFEYE